MKYKSIYSDSLVTETQYIAELIIKKQSEVKSISLPKQFWKNNDFKSWTVEFRKQKMRADTLVKCGYSAEAIIRVLKENKYIVSLYMKTVENLVHEADRKIKLANEIRTESKLDVSYDVNKAPVPKFGSSSKRKKLDE